MTSSRIINPFYAARLAGLPITSTPRVRQPVYAKLPTAPITGSPVPELTSLYHNPEPGPYGDRGYPGNCSGNLIRDLLRYFSPRNVFDPLCAATHNGSSVVERVMWCPAVASLATSPILKSSTT
jgi:hypothetical protein